MAAFRPQPNVELMGGNCKARAGNCKARARHERTFCDVATIHLAFKLAALGCDRPGLEGIASKGYPSNMNISRRNCVSKRVLSTD